MITPVFKVSQNDQFVLLDIFAKFIKANDVEIYVEESLFKFYVKPYFLRLNFPGQLCDESEGESQYDVAEGVFHFKLKKKTPGEFFEDLDMLTTLMAPKKDMKIPLIEEISQGEDNTVEDENNDEDEVSWDWPQQPIDLSSSDLTGKYKYGFANSFTDVLTKFQEETEEFMDLLSPDTTSYEERRTQRTEQENTKFDVEHYLADFFEDDTIQRLCDYTTPWQETALHHPEDEHSVTIKFDEEEESVLRQLTNKSYLLSKTEERRCLLGLVDILYAYCYNCRTTEGDNTSESPWTLCKISATLSWLDTFDDIREVVLSSYRRSLCFPLYRNWKLSQTVLRDVRTIFRLGKGQLVKSLIAVRKVLMKDESRYILNEMYIKDYIVWCQSLSKHKLLSFSEWLNSSLVTDIQKPDIGFNLEQIESVFATDNNNDSSPALQNESVDSDITDSSSDDSGENSGMDSESSLDSDDEEAPAT